MSAEYNISPSERFTNFLLTLSPIESAIRSAFNTIGSEVSQISQRIIGQKHEEVAPLHSERTTLKTENPLSNLFDKILFGADSSSTPPGFDSLNHTLYNRLKHNCREVNGSSDDRKMKLGRMFHHCLTSQLSLKDLYSVLVHLQQEKILTNDEANLIWHNLKQKSKEAHPSSENPSLASSTIPSPEKILELQKANYNPSTFS